MKIRKYTRSAIAVSLMAVTLLNITSAMADPTAVTLPDPCVCQFWYPDPWCFPTIRTPSPPPVFPDPCVCQFWYPKPWRFPCI